jgi:hypothetical protein
MHMQPSSFNTGSPEVAGRAPVISGESVVSEDDSWGSSAVQVVVADDARPSFMVVTHEAPRSGRREGSQLAVSAEAPPVEDSSNSSAPARREQEGNAGYPALAL